MVVATSRARNRSWVAIRIAVPRSRWRTINSWNSAEAVGSRPDVGSSRSNAPASLMMASAMPTFWRMPLE
ncbi:hypothetical protein G6F59_018405 [Rhizopus arrhizus]|nr:hypothetical protein G6F59_018405 [Rhizopus arrhizus]